MKLHKFLAWIFIGIITTTFLISCGHSVAQIDRGTGLVARIPLPEGGSLIELKLGNVDTQSLILRGGASFLADNAKGGTFGTVSTGDHIQMSTQLAMNEGYMAEVLTSPNTDPNTKLLLAESLIQSKTQELKSSSVKSVNAGAASSNKETEAESVSTRYRQNCR